MDERERRRKNRGRKAGKGYDTVDLGNGVVQASEEAVLRAMGGLPPDMGWDEIADLVVPVLPRRRPLPPQAGPPLLVTLPPGIPVGMGIDIGPAFLLVGEGLLAQWKVGRDVVVAKALANLRARVKSVKTRDLIEQRLDGVPTRVLQTGVGGASTLLLLPDELIRIFGKAPQLFLAPMRDILISMPAHVDRLFAGWLNDEFAAMDPNGLALEGVVLEKGVLRVEQLPRWPGGAPDDDEPDDDEPGDDEPDDGPEPDGRREPDDDEPDGHADATADEPDDAEEAGDGAGREAPGPGSEDARRDAGPGRPRPH